MALSMGFLGGHLKLRVFLQSWECSAPVHIHACSRVPKNVLTKKGVCSCILFWGIYWKIIATCVLWLLYWTASLFRTLLNGWKQRRQCWAFSAHTSVQFSAVLMESARVKKCKSFQVGRNRTSSCLVRKSQAGILKGSLVLWGKVWELLFLKASVPQSHAAACAVQSLIRESQGTVEPHPTCPQWDCIGIS